MANNIPERCTECGNEDIEVNKNIGVWAWNWTCYECNTGDAELKNKQ